MAESALDSYLAKERRAQALRDRFEEFRAYWANRYRKTIDFSQLDRVLDSFEVQSKERLVPLCACCGARIRRGESPDPACFTCEMNISDEVNFGWNCYCEARHRSIGFAILGITPGSGNIPGYTQQELNELRRQDEKTHALLLKYVRPFIKNKIAEHIAQDGRKLEAWEAGAEDRERQKREEQAKRTADRLGEIEARFVSTTAHKYGKEVLCKIPPSEVAEYCEKVRRGGNEAELYCDILEKYAPDQNTESCLYFIKQGTATKIGITDSLDSRLAQIRTSAAFPCAVANVIYTHFGRQLEQRLHRCLRRFNTHLEWFDLPPHVEEILFRAKSRKDIENFLTLSKDTL